MSGTIAQIKARMVVNKRIFDAVDRDQAVYKKKKTGHIDVPVVNVPDDETKLWNNEDRNALEMKKQLADANYKALDAINKQAASFTISIAQERLLKLFEEKSGKQVDRSDPSSVSAALREADAAVDADKLSAAKKKIEETGTYTDAYGDAVDVRHASEEQKEAMAMDEADNENAYDDDSEHTSGDDYEDHDNDTSAPPGPPPAPGMSVQAGAQTSQPEPQSEPVVDDQEVVDGKKEYMRMEDIVRLLDVPVKEWRGIEMIEDVLQEFPLASAEYEQQRAGDDVRDIVNSIVDADMGIDEDASTEEMHQAASRVMKSIKKTEPEIAELLKTANSALKSASKKVVKFASAAVGAVGNAASSVASSLADAALDRVNSYQTQQGKQRRLEHWREYDRKMHGEATPAKPESFIESSSKHARSAASAAKNIAGSALGSVGSAASSTASSLRDAALNRAASYSEYLKQKEQQQRIESLLRSTSKQAKNATSSVKDMVGSTLGATGRAASYLADAAVETGKRAASAVSSAVSSAAARIPEMEPFEWESWDDWTALRDLIGGAFGDEDPMQTPQSPREIDERRAEQLMYAAPSRTSIPAMRPSTIREPPRHEEEKHEEKQAAHHDQEDEPGPGLPANKKKPSRTKKLPEIDNLGISVGLRGSAENIRSNVRRFLQTVDSKTRIQNMIKKLESAPGDPRTHTRPLLIEALARVLREGRTDMLSANQKGKLEDDIVDILSSHKGPAGLDHSINEFQQGRGVRRHAPTGGKGVLTHSPSYQRLGHLYVSMSDLDKGNLAVCYSNGVQAKTIPRKRISPQLRDVIYTVIEQGRAPHSSIERLPEPDRALLSTLLHSTKVAKGLGVEHYIESADRAALDRMDILKGMIQGGNDSKYVLKEMKELTKKMMEKGHIKRLAGMKILASLV